jgi:inner membrane protein
MGLVWFIGYLLIGVMQNERAEQAGLQLARDRGHVPENIGAKPGFGNLLLWKTIYEYDNHYYVDAMRAGLNVNSYQGTRVEKLDIAEDFPWLDPQSQQARDLERFQWFSNGYVAKGTPENSVIDIRYSMLPNEIDPLWGIQLSPNASPRDHVSYITNRQLTDTKRKRLLLMLYGDTLLH